MPYDIKEGTIDEYFHIIEPLFEEHYRETPVANCPELTLKLNYNVYKELETNGNHKGYVILDDNEVIGYMSLLLMISLQTGSRMAMTNGFFIKKENRSIKSYRALKAMFEKAELDLKEKYGIQYLILQTNSSNPLENMARLFGYTKMAVQYSKRL